MKFARYLKDTQVPEWKRAYIDYRGLKKLISAIKRAQESGQLLPIGEDNETPRAIIPNEDQHKTVTGHSSHAARTSSKYGSTGETPPLAARSETELELANDLPPVELPSPAIPLPQKQSKVSLDYSVRPTSAQSSAMRPKAHRSRTEIISSELRRSMSSVWSASSSGSHLPGPSANQPTNSNAPGRFLSGLRRRQSSRINREGSSGRISLPLVVVLPTLTALERQFIEKLDKELDKVETFYRARESEAMIRASALKDQLRELQDHRRIFHESKVAESTWRSRIFPHTLVDRLAVNTVSPASLGGTSSNVSGHTHLPQTRASARDRLGVEFANENGKGRERSASPSSLRNGVRDRLDPEEYQSAKKELKKAILQYYRFLELLNNYRVLNLTGFRKALKKFEKTARVNIQQSYMQEKVEACAFASGETIEKLIKEIEEHYAARFESGDMKKARMRLRTAENQKNHHFSTFRAGVYLGLALPAAVDGLYKSFQSEVRESLPYDALLLVYAVFMIPLLFCLLIGINIWVWRKARINYQFIFDLDIRSQLDSREYFELPSLLLCTLCYAFWLTFSRIGTSTVTPTSWPLVWVILVVVIMLNPLNILFLKSRWWLTRKIARLLASGTKPVEFTDFWLGDQFCSLTFTLSNLYFVGCAYNQEWNNVWVTCSTAKHWGIPFALASLPLVVRTVQSIKRYVDSRLYTHLINAGKYASNILYYLFFYLWRHNNSAYDSSLVLFVIFAVNYSLYTSSWDLLMDWSLFKHPAQHPFLRNSLVYSGNYYVYYVAIVTNVILRFTWIIYIPGGAFAYNVRAFIAAMLEIFRRWQWNFLRLENEHIGNTDQYRVTREVPLPYSFDDIEHDSDGGDEDDEEHFSTKSSWRRRQPVRMSHLSSDEDHLHEAPREA